MNNKEGNTGSKILIKVFILVCMAAAVYMATKYEKKNSVADTETETDYEKAEDAFEPAKLDKNIIAADDNSDSQSKEQTDDKGNKKNVAVATSSKLKKKSEQIRVLLSDTAEGYIQSYVEISCNTSYSVNDGTRLISHSKNDIITVNKDTLKEGRLVIAPNKAEGRLTISSIRKGGGTPSYRGTLYITAYEGGYTMVNELSVEEYLYGVVSSEVPADFDMEALKAQAVCARGFAYKRMESSSYEEYGADIDDTTSSQVYNNFPETAQSIQAVDDTKDIVPTYEEQYIDAFFFSTSCGVTCNSADVWGGKDEAYLCASMETKKNKAAKLSDETNFEAFIDNNVISGNRDVRAFEKDLPFYRWTVAYTYEDMCAAVARGIRSCGKSGLYVLEHGAYKEVEAGLPELGDVTGIEVTDRGDSGIVKEIVITGSKNTIKCIGQNNIRRLFCPYDVVITKQDGSEQTSWEMLPSAFFYVTKDTDTKQYIIKGGGFGHGVGMSQNGANEMAKLGYTYDDIIEHYYHGVELKTLK